MSRPWSYAVVAQNDNEKHTDENAKRRQQKMLVTLSCKLSALDYMQHEVIKNNVSRGLQSVIYGIQTKSCPMPHANCFEHYLLLRIWQKQILFNLLVIASQSK